MATASADASSAGISMLGLLFRSLTSIVVEKVFLPFAEASIACLPASTGTAVPSMLESSALPSIFTSTPESAAMIFRRIRRGSSLSARSFAVFSRSARFIRCAIATASWKRAHALANWLFFS